MDDGHGPGARYWMDAPPAANSETVGSPLDEAQSLCLPDFPTGLGLLTWNRHIVRANGAGDWRETRDGSPITRCAPGTGSPLRDAQDAQNTIIRITSSIARLHQVIGTAVLELAEKALPPVNVDFFPVYEDARYQPARFITGNATYDRKTGTVTLFPGKSVTVHEMKIWESSFIHAHEIAHHAIRFLDRDTATTSPRDESTEEALADVIAFLASGCDSQQVRDTPGLGPDRDPTSPVFADGSQKSTATILENPHRTGAARAFRMMSELPAESPATKLRIVLAKILSREI